MSAENELSELLEKHPKIHVDILALFKKDEVALRWLKEPRMQLSGVSPLSVLEQDPTQVENLIYQIKTGDLS
jgi:hypothetical protein